MKAHFILLALLLCGSLSVRAQATPHRGLCLILCGALTFDDLQNPDYPGLLYLAQRGAVGLMNCGVPGEPNPTAALRTLAEGQPMRGSKAEETYRVGVLRSAALSPSHLEDDPVGLSQWAIQRETSFVVIPAGGLAQIEAMRATLTPEAYRAARREALQRLSLLLVLLLAEWETEDSSPNVLLVSPYPPGGDLGATGRWNRLTPIVADGPDFSPGLLLSPTTRTAGLVANVDIAPTIRRLLQAAIPATMTGRVLQSVPGDADPAHRLARIGRMDYVAALNGWALWRFIPLLGACCGLAVVVALLLRWRYGIRAGRFCAPVFVFALTLPAALLLSPLLIPPTRVEYALRIVAWMGGLTAGSFLLARWLRVSAPVVVGCCTLALIAGDLLTGQALLKDSLLSDYPLSGIRYYGIGNEYLGIAVSFALLCVFAWRDDLTPPALSLRGRVGRRLQAQLQDAADVSSFPKRKGTGAFGIWLFLAFLFGWPGMGANAGSLIVTGAGFGVGAAVLLGKRPTWKLTLACMALGLGLAFVFGALEVVSGPPTPSPTSNIRNPSSSHMGAAIAAASGERGPAYLMEIALRKIGMNLRLLVSPWLLLAAFGVALAAWIGQSLLGETLRAVWQRRRGMREGMAAVWSAVVAALLFKDSGVVTATFLLGGVVLFWLFYAVTAEGQTFVKD